MLNALKRLASRFRPYRPLIGSQERLNQEYQQGRWDYLWSLSEFARFSVVGGYCRFLRPGGSLLEIGCGEGVLQDRLDCTTYKRYLGIDLSECAIDRARARLAVQAASNVCHPRIDFLVADARSYVPPEPFDVIIFNESLQYFQDPVPMVRRYETHLADKGIFIASIYRGPTSVHWQRIRQWLSATYDIVDGTTVTNATAMTWDILVFIPRRHSSAA